MLKGSFPIEKFGGLRTPFYYYDLGLLRRTLATVRECASSSPEFRVHYAVKANANPVLLAEIAASGLGADCVSGGEIRAALDAGFKPESIVYAGVGKLFYGFGLNSGGLIYISYGQPRSELSTFI